MSRIEIYDTTLRDGGQMDGINYSCSDKLKIIKLLDEIGIEYIEAGWPGANPKDVEVFKEIQNLTLKNSKIVAFGCTRKPNSDVNSDTVLNTLISSGAEIITIFGKTWDFHVTNAINTTLDENLNMIKDSIEFLKSASKKVFFDAEHFFDGFKANENYAIKCLQTAADAGAERIVLCDTNGGCMNNDIYKIVKKVSEILPDVKLGIHAHNDGDMAVANSIAAVEGGAVQVQGTFNGYGERCGNANLCSIIPNLQLKIGYDILGDKISKLVYISNSISEISNRVIASNTPFVGSSAFAHKAGIHASGVSKNSKTYEHLSPELIGNARKILVSDQAGTTSIKEKIEHLKLVNSISEADLPKIIEKMKKLEWKGYAFEGAEASFELMIMDILGLKPDYFELLGFRVIGDTFAQMKDANTEASVKLKINNEILHTVSEGDGPVNSLDKALRKALIPMYPDVAKYRLNDYKVRILDSSDGTAAQTRVNIETTDGYNTWDTVGVNTNIIEASYTAIVDSIVYGLMLNNVSSK